MRRHSIRSLMFLVALLAVNLGLVRVLRSRGADDPPFVLLGLLPLLDAVIVSLAVVASRYRFSLRRRGPDEVSGFWGWFALVSVALYLGTLVAGLTQSADFIDAVFDIWMIIEARMRTTAFAIGVDTRLTDFNRLVAILGTLISGPLLVVATLLAYLLRRIKLAVTPLRETASSS